MTTTKISSSHPEDDLIGYKGDNGEWQYFTAEEFRTKVISVAKGLLARGFRKGEAIAILARTRWEWTCLDAAITSIGGVVVPIYETDSPAQIKYIVNDSHVRYVIAENDEQLHKTSTVADECPSLEAIFVIDTDGDSVIDILEEFGKSKTDEDFWAAENNVSGSDLATIVYTSGSTGTPKGIELTHSNFVFVAQSGDQSVKEITPAAVPAACACICTVYAVFQLLQHYYAGPFQ